MTKISITPFDKDGNVLTRGKTSVAADATAQQINEKVAYSAKRAGKKTCTVEVEGNILPFTVMPDGTVAPLAKEVSKKFDFRRGQHAPNQPVILTLLTQLEDPEGGYDLVDGEEIRTEAGWTIDELVLVLAAQTGRNEQGLAATIRTQLSRLRRDGHNIVRTKTDGVNRYKAIAK
jgi:hypothetical protein